MKTPILIFILILLLSSNALADPLLISDPYGPCGESGQTACPVSADIFIDDILVAGEIALEVDLSVAYDLQTMPTDEHSYTAIYYDELGRPSDLSNPFLLLEKQRPPLNLRGKAQR